MAIAIRKKKTLKRSEQLRRKRQQKMARTLHGRSRAAAAHPAAPQPAWEIRPRGGAAKVHRMYSIPLEQPGVEVQLPVRTLSFSPRSLAAILAVLACAGLLFALTSPMFQMKDLQVRGLQHLNPDGVAAAADVQGGNLFLLSPADMAGRILDKIPAVRGVSVSVGTDGTVVIDVREREPILLWVQDGTSYWVDADGVFFPALGERSDLIRLEEREKGVEITFDGAADIDPAWIVQALELTVALPSGTQLLFDLRHGMGMMDPGGWMVYFGKNGDVDGKLDVYRRLMESLGARGIRPGLVSVEHLGQPYYRR
jgi:hypothetical protein